MRVRASRGHRAFARISLPPFPRHFSPSPSLSLSLSLPLFLAISISSHRAGGKRTGVAKLRKELERFYQVED